MPRPDTDLRRTFYLLGSITLAGALLYWARPVLILVLIAMLATFILAPMVAWLERRRIPRFIASTIAVLAVAVLLIGIVYVFILQTTELTSDAPAYKTQISAKIHHLRTAVTNSWLGDAVDLINDLVRPPAEANDPGPEPRGGLALGTVQIPFVPVIQSVAGTLFDAVLVLILALLMLVRREDLRNRLIYLLGADNLVNTTRAFDEAGKRISRFLFFQALLNIGFGAAITIGLYVIGIPYAYVWGALAALLRYIPFLGGWIAAAFPLFASLTLPDWTPFFLTAAFFVIVELLQANLVEPLVFGHSIGVSGAGLLIAALFWGSLWGPVGLILSTPLTACLCVLGRYIPALRGLAALIGDQEVVEKPAAFYQRLLAEDSTEASDLAEKFAKDAAAEMVVDEMLIPALLLAQSDQENGELTREDQLSITDAIRDIFYDVVAPLEEDAETPPASEDRQCPVLVIHFPFNNDIDDFIIEMLRTFSDPDRTHWACESVKSCRLDGLSRLEYGEPSVILLATTAKKNLARMRGACRTLHKRFSAAAILVCCWRLEADFGAIDARLRDAGVSAICTTFPEARRFIDSKLHAAPSESLVQQ